MMIFETIYGSAQRGELILVDGGYCRWHRRRDGVVVIYEIISTQRGAGSRMLSMLPDGAVLVAKCPEDLESNSWYRKKGFMLVGTELTASGRVLNIWRRGDDRDYAKQNASRKERGQDKNPIQQSMSDLW